ncbi:hypothetical protein [Aquisphaera insulae]|uniref:hypothetical protein n=1 Tax=Aquisphaera insulae TaxID=2712864 RepID=UPI0013ED0E73|nr:hypothetical protein [Aquisphaera insulae]
MMVRSFTHGSLRRRGITIIEMMVMMSGLAAMLGMCAMMLQLLLRLDADGRTRIDGAVALARLAEQFRNDAHAAASASLVEKEPGLRLVLGPEHEVLYDCTRDARLGRVERLKGAVVRRETYPLSARSRVRPEVREDGPYRFAVLAVDRRTPDESSSSPRLFEVVAQIGRNSTKAGATSSPPAGGGTR